MPIYFDVSAAVHRRAGLGRYAESLARALLPRLGKDLAFFYNAEAGIEPLAGLSDVPARTVALGYKPWRMLVWLSQLTRTGMDQLMPGARLYHATEHLLPATRRAPAVLTVHDLIFRRYPQHHKPLNRWYLNLTMPLYCARASHIIAVSEQTKRDVMAAYGAPGERITVIYEAAEPQFRPQTPETVDAVRRRYNLPRRYLLFVGTIEPRKNLGRVLTAFETLRAEGLADALVIAGKRGWLYDAFFERLNASPAKEAVIFPGFIPDADLPAVYAGAAALAFPSEFEGFGLPVLEAMACGAPVLTATTSSLPEVAGDAALLVDPADQDAITAGLRRLLTDGALAADLVQRGYAQAAKFSWERAAEETIGVYEQVMRRCSHSRRDG